MINIKKILIGKTYTIIASIPHSNIIIYFLKKGRTHCVDTTITNILEGRVSYVPEKQGAEAKPSSNVNRSSPSNEVGILI